MQMDADGLTISNPGGFIEGVTFQNILRVEPHGRNPALADALKRIGLAERSGRGVDRIFEGSLKFGRDLPDYSESTSTCVKLFIPRGMPDEQIIRLLADEQRRTGEPMPLNTLLVLHVLRQNRRMTLHEIVRESNIPEGKAHSTVERLTEASLLEAIGTGRSRAYVLSARLYKRPEDYVRQTDVDQLRYRELVLKLAKKKGFVTRSDVSNLLHISPPQAYRLLKRLSDDGELVLTGSTRNVKYLPK